VDDRAVKECPSECLSRRVAWLASEYILHYPQCDSAEVMFGHPTESEVPVGWSLVEHRPGINCVNG